MRSRLSPASQAAQADAMPSDFGPGFWDHRYATAGDDFVFGAAPNDFLAACAATIPSAGAVLCLGEGEGRNAVHLATLGHTVTAVDQSRAGLAKAARLAAARGVGDRFIPVVADLADFVIEPDRWAAVVSIFCHLPPDLRRSVHARAAAGLIRGGVVILESYHPDQVHHRTGGPVGAPELLLNLDDARAGFPGLSWHVARAIERDVVEGAGHTGRAAVVQLCGSRVD